MNTIKAIQDFVSQSKEEPSKIESFFENGIGDDNWRFGLLNISIAYSF